MYGSRPENRMWNTSSPTILCRFANHLIPNDDEDSVMFTFCQFTPGQMQALLEIERDYEHRSLAELLAAINIAEQKAPSGKEYLHGLSYIYLIKDHFYIIQHQSLQANSVEEYINWILEKAGIIEKDKKFSLKADFDRAQIGDLSEIKSVEVGSSMLSSVDSKSFDQIKAVDGEDFRRIGEQTLRGVSDFASDVLKSLFGETQARKILESIPDEANLEMKINLGLRSRKKGIERSVMQEIAGSLRDLPDGQVRVRGRDGEIKGEDARLSADMTVKTLSQSSSLLSLEDALATFKEVHRRFLFDGRIADSNVIQ